MDKQKHHEAPMSFKLFACCANCELEACNSTIAKVRMGFKLWAPPLRSSMSKDFTHVLHVCKMGKGRRWNKYSWASWLVTWLLQINIILGSTLNPCFGHVIIFIASNMMYNCFSLLPINMKKGTTWYENIFKCNHLCQ